MKKPILCLDFDGVIHSYEKGWQGGEIYGSVTPGFFEWAEKAKELFILTVYSSRSKDLTMNKAMIGWLYDEINKYYGPEMAIEPESPITINDFEFVHEKPPAFLTIDDRGLTFTGDWSKFDPELLIKFKPWNVQ